MREYKISEDELFSLVRDALYGKAFKYSYRNTICSSCVRAYIKDYLAGDKFFNSLSPKEQLDMISEYGQDDYIVQHMNKYSKFFYNENKPFVEER